MTAWAAEELQYADLGDVRRNKRLMRLVSDLASQPNVSVPQASGDWAATQGAYDFWRSPHVKPEAIRQAHQTSTIERVKQQAVVIAIQDTTEKIKTNNWSDCSKPFGKSQLVVSLLSNSDGIPIAKHALLP